MLFFANQCLLSIGMFLGTQELTAVRLPYVEEALHPVTTCRLSPS